MRARSAALGALVAGALGASTSTGGSASPIEYIIVVMMENRSFDHLLGHLAATNPKVDGCLPGKCSNPTDPLTPGSPVVQVNNNAVDGGPVDPHHDFDSITQQVFGFKKPVANTTAPCLMNGFVANAAKGSEDFVMSAFNATNLPVLTTLANEFAVFDHWHCASPTPTNPNREFLMSGTAHGMIVNDLPDAGFPQQTHFAFLEARNVSWRIYYNDDPWMAPAFKDLRTPERLANNIVEMPAFFADLTAGTLPRYSLVEPRMASSATGPSNWQHPDNSVQAGEAFYSEIYTALRASPYWEKTLLIITFDEHGGFHDHVPTPSVGVPSPDGIAAPNGFQYDRLGVRVPTVMVSPWIAKGTTVGLPSAAQAPTPTSQFDATSIISTANKIFGIADNMTRRDAWAATFLDVVSGASGLRTDCPMALPAPPPLTAAALRAEMAMPLNDHHLDSLNLLCHLAAGAHPACASNAGAGRDAYLASLGAAAVEPVAWAAAVAFPHLAAAVAPLLRQEHFGAASAAMYAAYKASVGVGAGAGAVA